WSTDWFKDREGQIERLMRLIDASRIHSREAAAAQEADAEARRLDAEQREQLRIEKIVGDADDAPPPAGPPPPDEPAAVPVQPYVMTDATPRWAGTDILAAPQSLLLAALREVVDAEAPVHMDDVETRVAAMWGLARTGSRITARIGHAMDAAAAQGILARRGDFIWGPDGAVTVRSRRDTKIPAERIAPEEYREAALAVLRARGGLPRKELMAEVRTLLGFTRLNARLEEAITTAVDALLADGTCGEASTGIRLRQEPAPTTPAT
ncbi:MAG TPA: DUF3320 domain-containing protein, partial [Longimicrobium sp.]|nr:DUF3320 domain-containing protein [Longimicrobium sp.]